MHARQASPGDPVESALNAVAAMVPAARCEVASQVELAGQPLLSARPSLPREAVETGVDPVTTCVKAGIHPIAAIGNAGNGRGMAPGRGGGEQQGGEDQWELAHGRFSVGVYAPERPDRPGG